MSKDWWQTFENKTDDEIKDFIFSTFEKILKMDRKHIESIELEVSDFPKLVKNDKNFIQSLIEIQKKRNKKRY